MSMETGKACRDETIRDEDWNARGSFSTLSIKASSLLTFNGAGGGGEGEEHMAAQQEKSKTRWHHGVSTNGGGDYCYCAIMGLVVGGCVL